MQSNYWMLKENWQHGVTRKILSEIGQASIKSIVSP